MYLTGSERTYSPLSQVKQNVLQHTKDKICTEDNQQTL